MKVATSRGGRTTEADNSSLIFPSSVSQGAPRFHYPFVDVVNQWKAECLRCLRFRREDELRRRRTLGVVQSAWIGLAELLCGICLSKYKTGGF